VNEESLFGNYCEWAVVVCHNIIPTHLMGITNSCFHRKITNTTDGDDIHMFPSQCHELFGKYHFGTISSQHIWWESRTHVLITISPPQLTKITNTCFHHNITNTAIWFFPPTHLMETTNTNLNHNITNTCDGNHKHMFLSQYYEHNHLMETTNSWFNHNITNTCDGNLSNKIAITVSQRVCVCVECAVDCECACVCVCVCVCCVRAVQFEWRHHERNW